MAKYGITDRSHLRVASGETEPSRRKYLLITGYKFFLYYGTLVFLMNHFPNSIWDPEIPAVVITLGIIGIWRYSWWFNHYVRSEYYYRVVYPRMRRRADEHWNKKPFDKIVHFMMTTYLEDRDTSRRVVRSICEECRASGRTVKLWLGSSLTEDEELISEYLTFYGHDLPISMVMIRQYGTGKRQAIGLVLRAMVRSGIDDDDMVIFMDGDSILGTGVVQKCASLFAIDDELQAVTTDEEVVCFGPRWLETWLKMRFAQRRIAMQSHSISGKVLTLTGRMSAFRAFHLKNLRLIRLLEADFLEHWLWGRFMFLSGDDKSTWYYMLLMDAKLQYTPDVCVYTVEVIEGSGMLRMFQNFRRWSGNMLRNGQRALNLGPKKIGWFIWLCILDQRVSMWTMLISPALAGTTVALVKINYFINYLIWIAFSRMGLSIFLYRWSDRVYFLYPWLLYINQITNAVLKVYSVFRLHKQKWSNRGYEAKSDHGASKEWTANYLTAFWVANLILWVMMYAGVVDPPSYRYFADVIFASNVPELAETSS